MYLLYRILLALAAAVAWPYFLVQGLRHGKYLGSLRARLGLVAAAARSPGDAIWLHAVSVGEVLACENLSAALKGRFPDRPLLVSTTTETGFATAQKRLKADAFFYCPFDFVFAVRRVLRQVQPALLVVAETELWPNLLREAACAGARVAVVNARVSDRSFPRYRALRFFFRHVLKHASLLVAQSEEDARRLREIGAEPERIRVAGNLKYDRPAPPTVAGWLDRELRNWAAAGTLVAGSTALGEEEYILAAFERLRHNRPALRLILAPRRPERFDEVGRMTEERGLRVVRRSRLSVEGRGMDPAASVLLLDTVGELSAFYRYATIAFVGGSLVPHGGQNILEPAQFGRPIVVGPSMSNFREMARAFLAAGALRQVESGEHLAGALENLWSDPAQAEAMGSAARRLLEESRGAAERVVEALADLLPATASPLLAGQAGGRSLR